MIKAKTSERKRFIIHSLFIIRFIRDVLNFIC